MHTIEPDGDRGCGIETSERPGTLDWEGRMMNVHEENLRLQRLVAELLLKNQQLREKIVRLEN